MTRRPARGAGTSPGPATQYHPRKESDMLRITQSPAAAAATAEHPVASVGRQLVRYGLVVVIAWIGALKYTSYEAAAGSR